MTAPNQRWARERPEIIEAAVAGIPAGHAGDPEDLGPLAVYLASDASRYMTGAALTIDYTLHEWEMSGDGFVCSESDRRVRGFKHLSESEREAALPRAAPHIREMHLAAAED